MNAMLPLPALAEGMTPIEREQRKGRLTASRVGALMSGNKVKLAALYNEMVEELWGAKPYPDLVAEDLSGVWAVQLGTATEPLNLHWYERKTGRKLKRVGVVQHPEVEWAAATPDGLDLEIKAAIECKHVGGREPLSTVHARYMPQVHWQIDCCRHLGIERAVFSVIEGAQAPKLDQVQYDAEYGAELWRRARDFWRCVESMTPPVEALGTVPAADLDFLDAPVAAPPPMKEYDFTGNNAWADCAVTWLETVEAATKAAEAERTIKLLMPKDAKRAFGHGVAIERDRRGYLKLKALGA